MEEWKTITDYPNYEISNLGNVRYSKKTLKNRLLPKNRYQLRQGLYTIEFQPINEVDFVKTEMFYIHQVVARAFIPNPDNLKIVDFIDNCTTNNSSSNLRWVSKEQYQIIKNEREKQYQQMIKKQMLENRGIGNFYGTTFGGSGFKTYT